MQRRRGPPPFPEEAGHRPKITRRTSSLVTMGTVESILFSVVVHHGKGQDCEGKRQWQRGRVGQIKPRWRQVVHVPFCRNPVSFVLLCLTELTSWPQTFPSESPLFYSQRSCHIVPIPAPLSASPFPWKSFPGSLSISDPHVHRVVALGSKSGGDERKESEGVKSVSHDLCYISSKHSCVIM